MVSFDTRVQRHCFLPAQGQPAVHAQWQSVQCGTCNNASRRRRAPPGLKSSVVYPHRSQEHKYKAHPRRRCSGCMAERSSNSDGCRQAVQQ